MPSIDFEAFDNSLTRKIGEAEHQDYKNNTELLQKTSTKLNNTKGRKQKTFFVRNEMKTKWIYDYLYDSKIFETDLMQNNITSRRR